MQAARIWFRNSDPAVTLSAMIPVLEAAGARVEATQWQLGSYIVPQLRIVAPTRFLMQLSTHADVAVEARECADRVIDVAARERLAGCDARFEFGSDDDPQPVGDAAAATVFAGWTAFDPAQPQARALLRDLARAVQGVLEDNVNGGFCAL